MKIRGEAPRHGPRLFSRRRENLVYGVLGGVWLSGAAWLVLHYAMRRAGEFGSTPHPLEAWVLKLHGAFAFAVLGVGGLLWVAHIVPMWLRGHRRPSGIVTAVAFALLALSGYLLYYSGDENLRAGVALAHWLLGLAALVPVLIHVLRGSDAKPSRAVAERRRAARRDAASARRGRRAR
jgi:hypothetical protein